MVSLLIGVASIIASLATVAYRLGSRLTGVEKDIEAEEGMLMPVSIGSPMLLIMLARLLLCTLGRGVS